MQQSPAVVFAFLTLGLVVLFAATAPVARAGPSQAETRALENARRHVAAGGAADAPLGEDTLLLGAPAYPVTRLHKAAESGWLTVARFLLDHGANPMAVANSKSHYNQLRPLELAILGGHTAVVRLLKERALPPVGQEQVISIDLGAGQEALPLVSLEEGGWTRVTEDNAGGTTTADLLIEPGDPEISGLGGADAYFVHLLEETAVALVPGGRLPAGHRAPPGVEWRHSLGPREIRVGMTFLARTSLGAIFRVRLAAMDARRGTLELRYARLESGRASPGGLPAPPTRGPAAPSGEALTVAVYSGDVAAVERLLNAGVDPKTPDASGRNALHVAASRNQVDVARMIVTRARGTDDGGPPSFDRFLEAYEGLLEARDAKGLTPLHVAAFAGHADVTRVLLSLGADVNAPDEKGRTALHLAAMQDQGGVIQVLIEQGSVLNAQDTTGASAADLASDPNLANALREVGRRQPDTAQQAVPALLNALLGALEKGDLRPIAHRFHPEEVKNLPTSLEPLPFTARLASMRIGVLEGEAKVVLALERAVRVGDELLLTVTFTNFGGLGDWRIRRVDLGSNL